MSTNATDERAGAPDDPFAAKDQLFGVGIMRDPHPRLHELMQAGPVHHGSMSGQFDMIGPDNLIYPENEQVSVVGFWAVDEGFRDPERFSSSWYVPALGNVIGRTILEMDPPEHYRFRLLLQGAFSKKEMQRWEREFVITVSTSLVTMRELSADELARYIATTEPLGKAGAYAIQGRAAAFITRIEGSYSGVMGLPLAETAAALAKLGRPVL